MQPGLPRPITIVGGGLAGLALGITLRQRSVPVKVVEAGSYPRHRVCGEFISGGGCRVLEELGVLSKLGSAGLQANTAAFFFSDRKPLTERLPVQALCIARYELDALLAAELRSSGGQLAEHERWRGGCDGEGIVRATGRQRISGSDGSVWVGLKGHARNAELGADLEMHVLKGKYIGVSRLPGGRVNVCGLIRRPAGNRLGTDREHGTGPALIEKELRGPEGSALNRRLKNAEFQPETLSAVAALPIGRKGLAAQTEVSLGDAWAMIPPITGNGMSLALESAELAAAPLAAYSRGELSWATARERIGRAMHVAFARRLIWAEWLQRFMFAPTLQRCLLSLPALPTSIFRKFFTHTR